MEDPITVDVWAKVKPDVIAAKELFIAARTDLARGDALKAFNKATVNAQSVQLLENLHWDDAPEKMAAHQSAFSDFVLFQRGYKPNKPTLYCGIHDFYFGGVLGCPICTGFYKK